jgi:RNA polymerase sigma factor (sigma-70 family)
MNTIVIVALVVVALIGGTLTAWGMWLEQRHRDQLVAIIARTLEEGRDPPAELLAHLVGGPAPPASGTGSRAFRRTAAFLLLAAGGFFLASWAVNDAALEQTLLLVAVVTGLTGSGVLLIQAFGHRLSRPVIDRTDAELIAQAMLGQAQAIAEIVRRHQSAVRGFLRRICPSPDLADDLAQETFLAAFAGLAGFRGESSLRSWLCGIAYRKARISLRSASRRSVREMESALLAPPTGLPPTPDRAMDVRSALLSLNPEQRAAAALCLASDMSHAEAAAALAIPLGTLKSRVASARRMLVEALEDYR